jgi:hypothetical protein
VRLVHEAYQHLHGKINQKKPQAIKKFAMVGRLAKQVVYNNVGPSDNNLYLFS